MQQVPIALGEQLACLQIDVKADDVIFSNLRSCGAVATASSEERPDELDLGGQGFSVRCLPSKAAYQLM